VSSPAAACRPDGFQAFAARFLLGVTAIEPATAIEKSI
jgi:hypothetical protein